MRSIREYTEKLKNLPTPFYLYDMDLLRATLDAALAEAGKYNYKIHYALKANFNDRIIAEMRKQGMGIDCVSGNEVRKAIESGIPASEVVFAGVAKSDDEITYALRNDIFSFNCESFEELEVIDGIARKMNKIARIALRLNPDVDPKTHRHISTGKADNKFGISYEEIDRAIASLTNLDHLQLVGIHFHIGSQICDISVFEKLCQRVNEIQAWFEEQGVHLSHLNLGGGLGIDYNDPETNPVPDFKSYFEVFQKHLKVKAGQTIHFELGRSLVGQCGTLVTRVLYNKTTAGGTDIVLVDASMTDLIRPALYQAHHRIENLTSTAAGQHTYTIAGPVCESTDVFARDIVLPPTRRGDLLALFSAGAYGRAMSSNYNLRDFPAERYTDDL